MNNTTLQRAAEVNKINKQVLTEFMRSNGINEIVIDFDGSGDSGNMEGAVCYPENKNGLMKTLLPLIRCHHRFSEGKWSLVEDLLKESAETLAEDIAYSVLENHHGGWEINEGSYGKIRMNADGSGAIEFHERVIETNYSEIEF
jgi:hypothetical protein